MRILFAGPAAAGHLFPMVPTAQALRAVGHEVLFASGQPLDQLRSAGFPVVEIGDGRSLREIFAEHLGGEIAYVNRDKTQEEIFDMAAGLFAHASRPDVDGLLAAATGWGADLIVHDSFHAAPPVVAALLKIPSVVHNFGVTPGLDMAKLIASHFTDVYEQHGLTGPAGATALNLGPLGGDPDGLPMRYIPYNGGGIVPTEFLHPADRPRIVVTLGTVLAEIDGVRAVVRLVESAAEVDADFLLAVGGADLAPLGTLPANVRGLPWVPLNELLSRADALVHHGGSGTMLTALQAGLPQLLLPQGADHFINADALTATGAALRSASEDVDTALLDRLITDADLRAAAHRLRTDNAALPTPTAVVPTLEALTTAS
ncbi:nucleotide disphospho-sugar-binding domain-containing protein [Streptomyces sp. 1331.2]|uniref:nucleotide disphospho-sugar-binding domain-containing protein n=1 Tax=Streptomyces sp. 1331.2 TaxID=1938835 RepID=UPI000BC9B517|nr:nucleotide disphospho-sugar-binding domain-containing protein [Streptomyces sp. 1331.2]SOB83025.1 UDP:flavonoid glycosyltransferase YjiC, YdhE family [Streptomyces sp. 1331.2]